MIDLSHLPKNVQVLNRAFAAIVLQHPGDRVITVRFPRGCQLERR